MTKTLVLTRRLPEQVEARARASYHVIDNPQDHPLSKSEILARAGSADGLLVSVGDPIDASLIAALPDRLRAIATFSVGTDYVDVTHAAARGIKVGNTPGVLTDATAEIALLLLLGAARRATEGVRDIRTRSWSGWRPTHLIGRGLSGKRLGILGMGRIGQAVARRAAAFGMEIHYHNRREVAASAFEGVSATYHDTLEGLLRVSDMLSLHCPSTPETRHVINADRLALLPAGAILINTARGDVVEDGAVIEALTSGCLVAAGLDVFDGEPNLAPAYAQLPNVFALPHLGSATLETRLAMGNLALDNLDAHFAGQAMPHAIC